MELLDVMLFYTFFDAVICQI